MKKILYLIIFVAAIGLTSCEKLFEWNEQKDEPVEYSVTWPLNGEWYVKSGIKDANGISFDDGYFKLYTYNTAANDADSIWIWDEKNFWDFKVKSAADPINKVFGKANYELLNKAYNSKVIIQNGQVFLDAATTTGGNKTDSIYLEILFDDDDTPYESTYVISGYRRTGFLEDEH